MKALTLDHDATQHASLVGVAFNVGHHVCVPMVTFKDSNWLMSIVLAHQPHFANKPAGVQVFWGYALFPDRIGDFIAKPMVEKNLAFISQFVDSG